MKKRFIFIFLIVIFSLLCVFTACKNGIELGENGNWIVNGEDTGIKAEGTDGKDGTNGKDGIDGANGKDGETPTISIVDGFWCINGVSTGVIASGPAGENGENGTRISINSDGFWVLDNVVTDKKAVAVDGVTPTVNIDENGYWVINGLDTGILARGINGITPSIAISETGYWIINGLESETKALGVDGLTPTINISENGYWVINDQVSSVKAVAQNGLSIYELYKKTYGYDGTEAEWISDVVRGTIGLTEKRTIYLDYNGAERGENPEYLTIIDGRTANLPLIEREGYEFLGWFTGNTINDGQWTNTLVISQDITLIARWKQLSFIVRFEDLDGELLKQETVLYGADATPPVAPSVDNYLFDSWDQKYTEIKGDITLRPVYIAQRYVVTFDVDGGTEIPSASYLYTETPLIPITPTKAGFVFDGWKLKNTDERYDFSDPLTEDTTLVAIWIDTIKIQSPEELIAMGDNLSAKYSLVSDINLNGEEWTPLGEFKGILEGNGYRIHNFMITKSSATMGFFTKNSGTIDNLIFADCIINNSTNDKYNMGVITAINDGTISNVKVLDCSFTSSTSVLNVQFGSDVFLMGIVCGTNNGNILNVEVSSSASLNIETSANASGVHVNGNDFGGICGYNTAFIDGVLVYCELQGKAVSSANNYYSSPENKNNSAWGGVVGVNKEYGIVNNVNVNFIASTSFISTSPNDYTEAEHNRHIGGVVGWNSGTINGSTSSGKIEVSNSGRFISNQNCDIGGIVGTMNAGKMNQASCDILITGSMPSKSGSIGGISGTVNKSTSVGNVYFGGEITATNIYNVGAIIGYNSGTLSCALSGGTVVCKTGNGYAGLLVGDNTSSGSISKCIIDGRISSVGTPKYAAGNNNGNITKIYVSTNTTVVDDGVSAIPSDVNFVIEKSKETLYSDSLLFAEYILDLNIWGICEGLSAYLLFASDHEHQFDNACPCADKYCTIPACHYVENAREPHSYINYKYNNDASCIENGTETAFCAFGCGTEHTRVSEGSAIGHSFTNYINDNNATCNTCSTETAPCNNVNCYEKDTREIENSKLGHYYINGKCIRCNEYSPDVLYALDTIGYYHVDLDKNSSYSLNDYIYFGMYPQSIKKTDVIIDESEQNNGAYQGSDGYKYVRVVATPNGETYKFSNEMQVALGTAYYFKIEPIRWQIKEYDSENGRLVLLASLILDCGSFQSNLAEIEGDYYNTTSTTPLDTFANSYEYSRVREWLNNTFYTSAFSALQQTLILNTDCNNKSTAINGESNVYASAQNNTSEKVYLYSYEDVVGHNGFNVENKDTTLCKIVTDFALANGAFMNSDLYGNWHLRSPSASSGSLSMFIDFEGNKSNTQSVDTNSCGIVPVVTITINDD